MVEIFIFPAVLIGVTSKVWRRSISQLPRSYLLDSLISEESESQPNYFNRIFSFSRGKKCVCRNKNRPLRNLPLFSINALLSVAHRCLNYREISGHHGQRQLQENIETQYNRIGHRVPLLTGEVVQSSHVIIKRSLKLNL